MGHTRALLFLCIGSLLLSGCHAGFWDTFQVTYGIQNVHPNDSTGSVEMALTADGVGPTFTTWNTYLFGSFKCQIKLVPGNSAGTVSAFFLTSPDSTTDGSANQHDEIDFEFLGNVSGQPYKVQTNIFANGTGGREEQMYLWFDPTADYHTYQVIWNHKLVLWLVDSIPIRVYNNIENLSPLTFPTFRPMGVSTCIYDASDWATESGRVRVNYAYAPFSLNFVAFDFEACVAQGQSVGSCGTNYSGNWWEGSEYQTFNSDWQNQMAWVREYYLQYDYCLDTNRYQTPPVECSYDHALSY
ncbi:unnamed protein product [Calypogeia fissa]